jgi:hypothetical protein
MPVRPGVAIAMLSTAIACATIANANAQQPAPSPAPPSAASSAPPAPSAPPVSPTSMPAPSATPAPSPTPQYRFVYRTPPSPVTTPFPGPNAPEINEIDLSDATLVPPANIYGRILTSTSVIAVRAETMGATLDIPKTAPGVFSLAASVPDVPRFVRDREFDVTFTATSIDGRTATVTLPLTIK